MRGTNSAIVPRLQSTPPAGRVAELGSLAHRSRDEGTSATQPNAHLQRRRLGHACLGPVASAAPARSEEVIGRIIHQDFHDVCRFLPPAFADLVILDPPYNLTKNYNGHVFQAKEAEAYKTWFNGVISSLVPYSGRRPPSMLAVTGKRPR